MATGSELQSERLDSGGGHFWPLIKTGRKRRDKWLDPDDQISAAGGLVWRGQETTSATLCPCAAWLGASGSEVTHRRVESALFGLKNPAWRI